MQRLEVWSGRTLLALLALSLFGFFLWGMAYMIEIMWGDPFAVFPMLSCFFVVGTGSYVLMYLEEEWETPVEDHLDFPLVIDSRDFTIVQY